MTIKIAVELTNFLFQQWIEIGRNLHQNNSFPDSSEKYNLMNKEKYAIAFEKNYAVMVVFLKSKWIL